MDCEDGGQIRARFSTVLIFPRALLPKLNQNLFWGDRMDEACFLSDILFCLFTKAIILLWYCRKATVSPTHHFAHRNELSIP